MTIHVLYNLLSPINRLHDSHICTCKLKFLIIINTMKFPSSKPLSCSSIIIFSIVVFNIFHNSGSTTSLLLSNQKKKKTSLLPKNETVPAFIVFGDSIVDTGNNNYIDTLVKCDFRPYGRDFIGGKPTGRFCNGKVTSDFLGSR